jgi:hypothetical protein
MRRHTSSKSAEPRQTSRVPRADLSKLPADISENEEPPLRPTLAAAVDIDPDLRHRMISETAYQFYAQRGYVDGYELDDWLKAEAEVDRLLSNTTTAY